MYITHKKQIFELEFNLPLLKKDTLYVNDKNKNKTRKSTVILTLHIGQRENPNVMRGPTHRFSSMLRVQCRWNTWPHFN